MSIDRPNGKRNGKRDAEHWERSVGLAPGALKDTEPPPEIKLTRASEVETKPVEWLWEKRIPKGKLTIFDGDPDVGKSVVTINIAAHVSTGRTFPDGTPCAVGNVIIANVEDAKDDTIVPRLKAAGADLSRVTIVDGIPDGKGGLRLLELPSDVPSLAAVVAAEEAVLLIADPVITMLGGDINKDQDARKALAPLGAMAEETGVAVVGVRHLNKNITLAAIQRGGGNMGLIGVARAGAFFAHHPDEDGLRVMAQHKSNLAEKPPSLQYRVVGWAVDPNIGRVEWKGVTDHDANSLASESLAPHEKTAKEEAIEFLREILANGPLESKDVFSNARQAGHTEVTVRRAQKALRIKPKKDGEGPWLWALPPKDDHHDQVDQVDQVDKVRKIPTEKSPYVREDDQVVQVDQDDHRGEDDHLLTSSSSAPAGSESGQEHGVVGEKCKHGNTIEWCDENGPCKWMEF